MKTLNKFNKNFVINTVYQKNNDFNEPVYVLNAYKNYVEAYSKTKNKKIIIKKIEILPPLNTKTFISIKEFFKKCTIENSEYKIKNVDNGNIYILVARFQDIGLFFKTNQFENTLFLTNINKYEFYKTSLNTQEALVKASHISEFERIKIAGYLTSKKNLKRDYLFMLKKSLEALESAYNKQKNNFKQSKTHV